MPVENFSPSPPEDLTGCVAGQFLRRGIEGRERACGVGGKDPATDARTMFS